jgi:hypothetical protein
MVMRFVIAVVFGGAVFAAMLAGSGSSRRLASGAGRDCAWRAIPVVDPHPLLYDQLNSVAAVSMSEAWAVGNSYTGREGGGRGAFVERWDGQRWRLAAVRIPRGGILSSVAGSRPGDVWAVGWKNDFQQLIEHWDGKRWHLVAPPSRSGILNGVVAITRLDAWAVGTSTMGSRGKTLIEHWDGTRWSVVPSPSPRVAPGRRGYTILRAVTAISRTDIWAAGYYGVVRSPVTRTLIEHWNGRRWAIVPTPTVSSAQGVTNDILFSISGNRPDDVWAVGSWGSVPGGYGGKGDHPLALHWDGHRWARVATPAIGRRALFYGVLARAGRAWAVGDRGLQPHQHALIERWNGARWEIASSPRGSSLAALSAVPGGILWAVGSSGRRTLAARC